MVDRVSPPTNQKLKSSIERDLGYIDQWPVSAEPFSQWIIEDNFAGEKPPFDQVGAVFVKDIAPFENLKLRFLNAGHSITSALGYLMGDEYIHQALLRREILTFVEQALLTNVLPICQIPAKQDGKVYIQDVIARFKNSELPYAVLQVGTDSSQKVQQRLFPSIDDVLAQGSESNFLSFALAAWWAYIIKALKADQLSDPLKENFADCSNHQPKDVMRAFLILAEAEQFSFFNHAEFMSTVVEYYLAITEHGASAALADFFMQEKA
jgi:fructuronate reductase